MPNAGTHAGRNYYQTPSTHTKRNCTTLVVLLFCKSDVELQALQLLIL